jgi:methionyl-tRNA formyltransferase
MTLRLAFMGTPEFATPSLAELIASGHDIACVYTQPPRPKGRGLSEEKSPVHKLAESAGIEVRTPRSLKDTREQDAFAALKLDAAIVVAYGLILPVAVLQASRLGCFNVHASLLPRWRGAAPIQRAIMAGDPETGVMVMRIEEGLDTGPVLMTERVTIGRKTFGELNDELARLGADVLGRTLVELEKGEIVEQLQDTSGVTYARKIEKSEARIDWKRNAREIDCQIRGLSPSPGAWFEAKGERIKVLLAEPVSGSGAPGEVLSPLVVGCAGGALKLIIVQRAGRAPIDAEAFLRGFALRTGDRLS